ncbi:kunitz/BPTI-like toxin [Protobothrops mucrosquamatus]|uniref:kunitz/BPTI-like toxin n=1 Tax=Protobothrops mucrosquamatus TaxID=103944 RepID=UPI000775887A|nr:kunitz/BPTI-like toxin [Protobothrops mucrosquamatus]
MSSGGVLLLLGLLTLWAELTPVSGKGRPELCYLPYKTEPCNVNMRAFYYNSTLDKCEELTYGECPGNANNFTTKDKCRYTCVEKPGVCPQRPHQPGQGGKPVCREDCKNDWGCPGKQKCCRYGCLAECKNAVLEKFASPTRRPTRIGSSVPT